MDQDTLNKLLDCDEAELIVDHCEHRKFEDIDGKFCCGLDGRYEPCKCKFGKVCTDFLPDESFEDDLRDVLESIEKYGSYPMTLPCPFCGSKITQVRWIGFPYENDSGYKGECCECFAVTRACMTKEDAAKLWNMRAK